MHYRPRSLTGFLLLVLLFLAVGAAPWLLRERLMTLCDQSRQHLQALRHAQERQSWQAAHSAMHSATDAATAPLLPEQIMALTRPMTRAELETILQQQAAGFSDLVVHITPQPDAAMPDDRYSNLLLTLSGDVRHEQDVADFVERLHRSVAGRLTLKKLTLEQAILNQAAVEKVEVQGTTWHAQLELMLLVNHLADASSSPPVPATTPAPTLLQGSSDRQDLRLDSILSYGDGRWVLLTNHGRWQGKTDDPHLDISSVTDDEARFVWHGDVMGRAYAFTLRPRQHYDFATGRVN